MPRIRSVKPEFFASQTIAGLDFTARLTFVGLWTFVDDEGRGIDEPRLVKAAVWPLDDDMTPDRVEEDLRTLANAGLIERWADSGSGRRYLRVRSFLEHQRINRPTKSKLPPSPEETGIPSSGEGSVSPHGKLTDNSPPERKGKERNISVRPKQSRTKIDLSGRNQEFLPFAEQLAEIIQQYKAIKHTPKQVLSWASEIRKLVETGGVSPERVQAALVWYGQHAGEEFVPVIEAGRSLREKFSKLEDAMRRAGAHVGAMLKAAPAEIEPPNPNRCGECQWHDGCPKRPSPESRACDEFQEAKIAAAR